MGQIVCWQVAAALVIAALGRPVAVFAAAAAAAASLAGLTMIRFRGRWLYQWIGVYARYQARDHDMAAEAGTDPRAALLGHVAPGGAIASIELDGEPIGVIEHAGGVCAILESTANDTDILADRPIALPSPATLLPLSDPDGPVVTTQVVIHSIPAPFSHVDAPRIASYRALTGGQIPAARRTWFAIQLERDLGDHSDGELRQALVSAVRRLRRRLRKDGVAVRTLGPEETLSALAALTHLEPDPARAAERGQAVPAPTARESWRSWSSSAVPQACFRLRRWPDLTTSGGRQLFDQLVDAPSLGTTVAVATRRAGTELEVEAAIRVAAVDDAQLSASTRALRERARACGAALERLDGEQIHGVAASLPLGGFVP